MPSSYLRSRKGASASRATTVIRPVVPAKAVVVLPAVSAPSKTTPICIIL